MREYILLQSAIAIQLKTGIKIGIVCVMYVNGKHVNCENNVYPALFMHPPLFFS